MSIFYNITIAFLVEFKLQNKSAEKITIYGF